jgi:hypothetical protein
MTKLQMKLIDYYKNKIFLILIGLCLIICSCKTSKASCDAYGTTNHENNTSNSDILVQHAQHQD